MLACLFDKLGLNTNVNKVVGIVCHLCQMSGLQLEAAYTRMMTGVGPYLYYIQKERVRFLYCI